MMDMEKYMTPRLLCITSFAEKGCKVADIGTDHAYIPIWLVAHSIAESAIAMDIKEGPLRRADDNIKKFSLESRISTRLSNGLEKLVAGEVDTVVIAGMGGILINEILEAGKHLGDSVGRYILQPMTAVEETRKYLAENGFCIENEKLAQEEDKIYCVLSVARGNMKIDKKIGYYVGEKLIEQKDPLLIAYLNGKIYEYEKAIASLLLSDKSKTAEKLAHFTYLSCEMKKIREECMAW